MRARRFDAATYAHRRWGPGMILHRAREVLRTEGPRALWFRVLGETVYRRVIVMERPFGATVPEASRAGLELGLLQPGELAEYYALRPDAGAGAGEIESRFARGHVCFVARREGRLIGACWAGIGRTWLDYLEIWIDLSPGVGYLYDLYVVPEERGLRIHASLFDRMDEHYGGTTAARVVISAFNPETRTHRLFARMGCTYATRLRAVRLGRWRWAFCRFEGERLFSVQRLQRS
jgi:hypothetical protein